MQYQDSKYRTNIASMPNFNGCLLIFVDLRPRQCTERERHDQQRRKKKNQTLPHTEPPVCMFEHVLIRITPSGGFIVGKAKERACPARRTNLVFVIGRGKVKLEGIRGQRQDSPAAFSETASQRHCERSEAISHLDCFVASAPRNDRNGRGSPSPQSSPLKGEEDKDVNFSRPGGATRLLPSRRCACRQRARRGRRNRLSCIRRGVWQ